MNKSIAGYKVFSNRRDYLRMQQMLRYFMIKENLPKFSQFVSREEVKQFGFETCLEKYFGDAKQHIKLISYCLMPTHLHLVTKQLHQNGISMFMLKLLNSYSRYFNTKYKRKGPLWVSRFKSVHVETDEQLLHLTRYLHLNPTTANLTDKPEGWEWSSYHEYLQPEDLKYPLSKFNGLLDVAPKKYQKFVNDQIDYQRELGKIKKLVLE